MASVNFSGQLDRPLNEEAAGGDKIYFYPLNTVGEIIQSAASIMTIDESGNYDITLGYNNYSLYYYSDVSKKQTYIANVTVSADTVVSTLPDLIGSTTPVTDEAELIIQGYLSDAQGYASDAESARDEALTSISTVYPLDTTEYLISSFDSSDKASGLIVDTQGFSSSGDGLGAKWVRESTTGTASQSPSDMEAMTLTDASGYVWSLVPEKELNAYQVGMDKNPSNTFYTAFLQFGIDNDVKLFCDIDIETNLETKNDTNVTVYGDGSYNAYSLRNGMMRPIIPRRSRKPASLGDGNVLSSLDFSGMTDIKVVYVGDSLMLPSGGNVPTGFSLYQQLITKMSIDNPGKTFTNVNLAMGGKTYSDLAGDLDKETANSVYPWYDDATKEWLTYIEDESPDIVFISFGMNDKYNFSIADFKTVVSTIEGFSSSPKIVFCTNMLPNHGVYSGYYGSYGNGDEQNGRNMVAGYVRSYANYVGYPCIDINRTFQILRDGRDVMRHTSYKYATKSDLLDEFGVFNANIVDGAICRNWEMTVEIDIDAFDTAITAPLVVFYDSLGSYVIIRAKGGVDSIVIDLYDSDGLYEGAIETGIDVPTDDTKYTIMLNGDTFGIMLGTGEVSATPFYTKLRRGGGMYGPRLKYFATNSGPINSIDSFRVGVDSIYEPSVDDLLIWGEPSSSLSDRAYDGGNGINHPSIRGCDYIYGTHMDGTNLKLG
jgi:hypothetical protein